MNFQNIEKLMQYLRKTKILALFVFIVLFSLVYMILDDKHFSGVNFIKETIKKQVIEKEIEKKTNDGPIINESFYQFEEVGKIDNVDVDKEIDKASKEVEKEIKEEDLTIENIESSPLQKLFDRVYFSINTSTLLGYGDIYPITNISKTIVMIQSLLTISLIVL
tara:strand:- start:916 stop:1407 length:492 start_codon:yes stop_codon:yes gene_type:complete